MTQDEMIDEFHRVHGETYDYSAVVYKNKGTKVIINCSIHGEFLQKPSDHLKGQGCRHCGFLRTASAMRKSKDSFIEQAVAVHGNRYDYSKVEYKSGNISVEIICKDHGSFLQRPSAHCRLKQGCPSCSTKQRGHYHLGDTESFITAAQIVHGTRYGYGNSVYTRSFEKVLITCKIHGDFLQSPNGHLAGKGCNSCKRLGYNKSRRGYLYVLRSENITKVGITNRKVSKRVEEICKDSSKEFSLLRYYTFHNGEDCFAAENYLLAILSAKFNKPSGKFSGYTECFVDVDEEFLYEYLDSMSSEGVVIIPSRILSVEKALTVE